ncbi:hypothetical protein GCM10007425_29480 [Lysinibacillus alkalisoli]|uniref:Uncharacterized protein n=1 Tax=Lysinibacillus alkalisoli TaxID=1911548 RepID=A0A917GA10_9BACI|nr:hypothetical protein [Lysinibacillus alkalisoli]GGG32903.1 hypothetical protein GCM10007425_29480 [Lysinibacillus alkalisoli]
MYKCLQYLKVNGVYVNKGDKVDLSSLTAQEIAQLEKKGIVVKVSNATVKEVQQPAIGVKSDSGDMTEEEARAELLEKITHSVAVKELELLGADFKKNASLETLVEIILANEEYENHFFDYIDANGL